MKPDPSSAHDRSNPWLLAAVAIFLGAIVWIIFGQTLHHGFINFDDGDYVVKNARVNRGLSIDGILWAFTHSHAGNWHPLTWISHMIDCQIFGLNPAGHHAVNVGIHGLTSILLFLVLRQMTRFTWRSAFVAAVFAIHPLHVESVAWVAERKDVLSGLFFVLTIAAYVRYVRKGGLAGYALVMVLFACGLMCKPMLVSLPFILLLLDYWPLRCFDQPGATPGRLIIEKIPLMVVGAASAVATIFAQSAAIQPVTRFPFTLRLGNAAIAVVDYLRQTFWPVDLAVFYPWDSARIGLVSVVVSVAIVVVVSIAVILLRKRRYLLTGWFWFLIMLGPVIGILQVGNQARADRYTYLPQIGVIILLTWAVADLVARWRVARYAVALLGALVLVPLGWAARNQTTFWQDSEQLWAHALACTTANTVAEENLGQALYEKGQIDEALNHFYAALRIEPNDAIAHGALGGILLGIARRDEAFEHLKRSLELNPKQASVHSTLGVALLDAGQPQESLKHLQEALSIDPEDADAHYNLGNTLLALGRPKEAVAEYDRAFQLNPKDTEALNNMAWILATWPEAAGRDGPRALQLAEKADALTQQRSSVHTATLAAAYAEVGRFVDAVAAGQRALQLAEDEGNPARADLIREQIATYETSAPYRDRRFAR
jgi:Flp pilus assembly protein TadD